MSDSSTSQTSPTDNHQQQLDEDLNLHGWGLVGSDKENLPMNEHQTGYLTNMYACEVIPGLFLGSRMASSDKAWLRDHNITHVLTVAKFIPPAYPESYTYKIINILDHTKEDIMKHFEETYKFIQQALDGQGKVLVHCQAGISRSPTVVMAYLMKSRKMSFDQAYELVESKRPLICPNSGFQHQLRLYQTMGCQ
ncbi:16781_t:CDS:2, partial [Acaulospora morrowiae]